MISVHVHIVHKPVQLNRAEATYSNVRQRVYCRHVMFYTEL